MTDQKQDISFPAATTQVLALSLANVDGTPFDLTGVTAIRFRASPFPSGDAILQATLLDGIGVDGDPTLGNITVTVDIDDFTDAGLYVFDVVATVGGVTTRCKYGRIVVGITSAEPGA